jgi:hypothetical protein
MTNPTYQTQIVDENIYTFASIGKKGIILKVVIFSEIKDNVYNLGFGDYNFKNDSIDDKVKSKNGDMEKILSTVISVMSDFFIKKPDCTIYLKGSNSLRTRLYQLAIMKYYEEFSIFYEILGTLEEITEPFQKNKNYESFLVRKLL